MQESTAMPGQVPEQQDPTSPVDSSVDLVFRKPEWCTPERWALITQRTNGFHDGYLSADADLETARQSGYDDGYADGQRAALQSMGVTR